MQTKKNFTNIHFVNAGPEYLTEAIAVASEAFSVYNISRELYEHRFGSDPQYQYTQLRVGLVDSRVVAVIRLYWRTFRVGDVLIPMAIIGDVAVARNCQGTGIGHALMQDTLAYLKTREILLAWLGGRPSFYSQFGFSLMRESRLIIDSDSIRKSTDTISYVLSTSPEDLLKSGQWGQLWDTFCEGCYSKFQRDADFATWLLKDRNIGFTSDSLCISVFERTQLVSYAMVQRLGKRLVIQELAWQPDYIDTLTPVFNTLVKRFPECEEIVVGGPKRPDLIQWLTSQNIKWRYDELASFPMVHIIDIRGLLEALYPNWQKTVIPTEHIKPLAIIDMKGKVALIDWQKRRVRSIPIIDLPADAIILNPDRGQLVKLLLGFLSAKQLNLGTQLGLSNIDSDFIAALFASNTGFLGDLERA